MSWFKRLFDTFRAGRLDRDVDEEMRFHLDMRATTYEQQGLTPDEARRRARARFGSPLEVRERVRDVRLLAWLDGVRQDAALGLRLLRRFPATAVVALLSLGLAIAATSGVFAVGDALLLRPLPVARAHDLLVAQWHSTEWPKIGVWGSNDDGNNNWSFAYSTYEHFAQVPGADVAGFHDLNGATTLVSGEASTADGALVTGGFFRVLGLMSDQGRLLADQDDCPNAVPAIVISFRYWQKTFGGSRDAIGRSMRVNGTDFTIVGVTPASFFGVTPGRWSDFYIPSHAVVNVVPDIARNSPLSSDRFWWLQLIVRPKPETTVSAIHSRFATLLAATVEAHTTNRTQHATFGFRDGSRGFAFEQPDAAKMIVIFTALVALVLLVACSNVANLLLARAASRQREAAMRLALGAGRLRVVRQHLTESLVLSLIGGAAGFVFGRWFAAAILQLAPANGGGLALDLSVTWRDVGFSAALSVAAGVLVGIVPATSLARASVSNALRAASVRHGWRRRIGLAKPLVATQLALSLLVLVVAGLFVRTLSNLENVPLGFNPDGIVLFNLDPSAAGYSAAQRAATTERVAERLRRLPGVTAVTWSSFDLLDNFGAMARIQIVGEAATKHPSCNLFWSGPRFHETLQIPLVTGRPFDERDVGTGPPVALVNQAFVKAYLTGGQAVGRSFSLEGARKPQVFEIVGIVGDSKSQLRQPVKPIAFFPEARQRLPLGPAFALRASGDTAQLAKGITRVVHETEPTLPVIRIRTYREQIAQQWAMERTLSLLSTAFGLIALCLAAIGLYGVVAVAVARRTSEIGVRVALGASPPAVLRLVMKDSGKVIIAGACAGIAVAFAATRFLKSLLFGLEPTDPFTLVAALTLLLVIAALAAFLPARRAAAIAPVDALRCE